ncbi:MAG: TIGR00282 family metallophosphoesterase [Candidatus Krumholzibacteriia bacterium]
MRDKLVIAFIGDIVGKAGRRTVANIVPRIKERGNVDLIVANLENAAGGFGITEKAFGELEKAGVDFFTSGNHIWDKKEGVGLLNVHGNLLRPANYPGNADGVGYRVIDVGETMVAIFNVQGRVFLPPIDCPFRTMDRLLQGIGNDCAVKLVDLHAEATSEKMAMGWYLDGRVSAVLGTHTHVPTRDARILPGGTGYVTDVGMTGARDSVLGVSKDVAVRRFLEMRPLRYQVASKDLAGDVVVLDIDTSTGRTKHIEHIQLEVEEQ